jgi:hypothetical protein
MKLPAVEHISLISDHPTMIDLFHLYLFISILFHNSIKSYSVNTILRSSSSSSAAAAASASASSPCNRCYHALANPHFNFSLQNEKEEKKKRRKLFFQTHSKLNLKIFGPQFCFL